MVNEKPWLKVLEETIGSSINVHVTHVYTRICTYYLLQPTPLTSAPDKTYNSKGLPLLIFVGSWACATRHANGRRELLELASPAALAKSFVTMQCHGCDRPYWARPIALSLG
jgi:hypothetical protein